MYLNNYVWLIYLDDGQYRNECLNVASNIVLGVGRCKQKLLKRDQLAPIVPNEYAIDMGNYFQWECSFA